MLTLFSDLPEVTASEPSAMITLPPNTILAPLSMNTDSSSTVTFPAPAVPQTFIAVLFPAFAATSFVGAAPLPANILPYPANTVL